MTAADEQHLLEEARRGNNDAYAFLIRRYVKQVYHIAFGFVRDHQEAEDITQEALVRAYHGVKGFRGDAGFGTWLYRIVTNLSLNRAKSRQRRSVHEVVHQEAVASAPSEESDALERTELQQHFERALHELPTMQRAVVILRHVDGLSTRQVSGILCCSEGTVKTHLFRGLKRLKKRLAYLHEGAS
jgi:RNA polymerase sigma-70 factor (ECF subfamily)